MNLKRIERLLEMARKEFLTNEAYLLSADANERSLTHKFAEYLQAIVGREWSVDCEYNRYGLDSKKIIPEIKGIVGRTVTTDATKAKTVYPDIIIHKRGPQGPNLLVMEAKKDASSVERTKDWRKLWRIRERYKYHYAAFINFVTAEGRIELELRG